ncbi:DUF2087 domain-containing protein [Haloplasma contractile]|uniref:Transcriptional regulator protein n=1 Tax=Haloplasma contractile SSD-17B TaxID=1033810 RepID=F7PWC0_9MOLU|nr:DUF2087 domain-containing protein [Haloplasma contractile]ERJ10899.1 Transcriptional regulator protein [Haloplasma contractile SSD-17B]
MSELNDLFFGASIEELKRGYVFDEQSEQYTCILCGTTYIDGVIYKKEETLLEARKAVVVHIGEKHESPFSYLLGLNKTYTGLSDVQKELLDYFYKGHTDKEIMKSTGKSSTSTIRNHRFKLKEKKKQAKIFLAIMELLEEESTETDHANSGRNDFVTVHKGATMVDDRYAITNEEKDTILNRYFDESGRLNTLPSKEKRKIVVLGKIASNFKEDKQYTEEHVNRVLRRIYDDYPTLRRYLIEYGFMDRNRDCSAYWIK